MAPEQEVERDRKDQARLVGFVIVLAILVGLGIDNRHEVDIGYIVGDARVRLVYLLLVTAVLGAVADRLLRWRRKHER
jgi:uncharacterized membrane protein YciS (DUF1049 family)